MRRFWRNFKLSAGDAATQNDARKGVPSDYESGGREFESLRARHSFQGDRMKGGTAIVISALLALLTAACASTSVTSLSANEIMISADVAEACGTRGAQNVALQQAAAETLRRGFDRFVILDAAGEGYSHDFTVRLFHDGEVEAETAIDARMTLGPDWQAIVDGRQNFCFGSHGEAAT